MTKLTDSIRPSSIKEEWRGAVLRRGTVGGVVLALLGGAIIPSAAHADAVKESPEAYYLIGLQDGEWQVNSSTSRTRVADAGVQMRIPSNLAMTVPDDDTFAWLGQAGEVRWGTDYWRATNYGTVSTRLVRDSELSADAQQVSVSVSNVVGPGSFAMYNAEPRDAFEAPATIGELFRWGTGEQRDGSSQSLDAVQLEPRKPVPYESVFGASGMYCFDMTASAVLADGIPVSDTKTMRVAVGDTVAADAPCGTATDETPQAPQSPAKPAAPTVEAAGSDVTVSWMAPNDRGSALTGYAVSLVNVVGSETLTREVDGTVTQVVFENVPTGYYRATVVATNAKGESEASPQSAEVRVGEPVRVVTSGHFDVIDPQVEVDEQTGELELALRGHHDELGWMDWDEFVIYSQQSRQLPGTFTPEDDWSFIGEPGQTIWEHPNPQSPTAPWPGLSVGDASVREHLATGERIAVTYEAVVGIDGGPAPGNFALDTSTTLRAVSKEGLPGGYDVPLGAHEHFGWYFSEPGVYCTAVRIDAVLSDGTHHTDRGLITHVVGNDIDPGTVMPCDQRIDYPEVPKRPDIDAAPSGAPFVLEHGLGNLSLEFDGDQLGSTLLYNSSFRNTIPERHSVEDVIFRGGAWYKDGTDNLYEPGMYALGFSSADMPEWGRDGDPYQLKWNTLSVPTDQIDGDITWKVEQVRGPGEFQLRHGAATSLRFFDTGSGSIETSIYAGREMEASHWLVTEPGKYCIDLNWSVNTRDHGTVTHSQTLTAVVEGAGFTHDADTLTQTCADGAEATEPGEGSNEPDPDPGDEPWNVPNWSATESGATILNLGHVDVASLVEDRKLDTKIKDTTAEGSEAGRDNGWVSWHEPENVVFQLLPEAEQQVPDREAYAFLGEPGHQFWLAPETQDHSILWPGWSTEHIPAGTLEAGVDWKLTGMEGPGDFFIYTSAPGSMTGDQLVHFNTADGIDENDVLPLAARAHVHGNWAFTAEGVYCLAFERTAKLADGTTVSDPFTLAVAVGETDPTAVDPANCAGSEPVMTVPDAPEKPVASTEGNTATVTWEAPGDGGSAITGYTVQLVGGEQLLVKEVPADVTEVVFEGVPAGTYTATVTAVNAIGASPASPSSDEITISGSTDPEATAPEAPAAPAATADGTAVTVEWTPPADGGSAITGYRVELAGGETPVVRETAADSTTVTFGVLKPGTYTATVVAINAVGESDKSAPSDEVTVAAVPDPGPEVTVPEAPAAPTAEVNGSTVSVAWAAPADGGSPITGYTVTLIGTTSDPIVQQIDAVDTTASFVRVPDGRYTATVAATNAKGVSETSSASAEIVVKADGDGTPGDEPGDQATPVPDSELTDASRGGIDVPEAATPGQQITVKVGASHAGTQVRVWLHSTPTLLGTVTLDTAGNTVVTIPADASLGDHKIVVQALNGSLIGWDAIKIDTADQIGPNEDQLPATGADGQLLPLAAGGLLLLLGAVILVGTAQRRRNAATTVRR